MDAFKGSDNNVPLRRQLAALHCPVFIQFSLVLCLLACLLNAARTQANLQRFLVNPDLWLSASVQAFQTF